MKTLAAVLVETDRPLELVELEIPRLRPGQVLVKIAYTCVCHTQVLEARGYRGEDRFLPHCLGHEASGVVEEVGEGVSKVAAGDQVVLSWIRGSGADVPSTQYDWDGRTVNSGAITTFSRYSVISENRLTAVTGDISLKHAALVGCALPTGLGAVFKVAAPRPGDSLAVFGVGGVGLSALMAAAVCGCTPIVAVDVVPEKLALARRLGATHVIDPRESDAPAAIQEITNGGVSCAVEASGVPAVMSDALRSVRPRGGRAVVIGNARHGQRLEIDPQQLNLGKRLLGTWGGDADPDTDFPRYCRLIAAGKLNVESLIPSLYQLENIGAAMEDLESGKAVRPMIDLSSA